MTAPPGSKLRAHPWTFVRFGFPFVLAPLVTFLSIALRLLGGTQLPINPGPSVVVGSVTSLVASLFLIVTLDGAKENRRKLLSAALIATVVSGLFWFCLLFFLSVEGFYPKRS